MSLRNKIASFFRELSSPPAALGLYWFGGTLLLAVGMWLVSDTPAAYAALRQSLNPHTVTSNILRSQLRPPAEIAQDWMVQAIAYGLIAAMGGLAWVAAKGIRCRRTWAWWLAGVLVGVSFVWGVWGYGGLLLVCHFPESEWALRWGSVVMFSPYHRFHMMGMAVGFALFLAVWNMIVFTLCGYIDRWWKRRKAAP